MRFSLNLEGDCISDRVWLDTCGTWPIFSYNYYRKYSIVCIDIAHLMEHPNTGQVASRLAFIRDAGHVPPNTGHPLKYGTSGNPTH